ncbi:MAG TPA: DUF4405 domain-containing protein [Bacteroidales bacterium]|nr:DUF4405 domain-containing protein [Bacteroidales bacterium]
MEKKRSFNLRSFTSFSLVISTIIMSWSGFILYVAPPGRIANWGDWQLMLFTKAEWQALHTIFSYMFFILVIIHLFFVNWRTFMTYLKSRLNAGLNKKWELLSALTVSGIFFIGTLQSWTPFGPVMTFGEKVKESWEGEYVSPPVAHMEEYDLTRLAGSYQGISAEELLKTLNDSSIIVDGTGIKLKEIASQNKITPARIYEVLNNRFNNVAETDLSQAPSGVGRMTLNEVARILDVEPAELMKVVGKEYPETMESSTMKSVSDIMGISPHDLYGLLYTATKKK